MAKKKKVQQIWPQILDILTVVTNYSTVVGIFISLLFLFIFIKSFFKKRSSIRSSFYFFLAAATIADIFAELYYTWVNLFHTFTYTIQDPNIKSIYDSAINVVKFSFTSAMNLDASLEAVMNFNRLTALVFPLHHNKVKILWFTFLI